MSHALPVVTTRGAAGLEAVGLKNGENVLAADAGAPAEVTAALLSRLAGDPELRAAMGRRAREWSGPFQWESVAERTIGLYEQVLRTKGISR
jgi:glycosyltransferase involved in cell wall biosynthesis